jgi:phosphoesterase RecJ-like protein
MNNATEMINTLNDLIKRSFTIVLVGHSSPDADALSSLIAAKEVISKNYEKDDVTAYAENIPQALSYIPGKKDVVNGSILDVLKNKSVDLIVCLDFNQWHMLSKFQAEAVKQEVLKQGIPIVVIDHHEEEGKNIDADCYLRLDPTSTAANLFSIFHENLEFELTDNEAQHLLIGIVGDTNRFKYRYGVSQSEILRKASIIQAASSMSVEDISIQMERYEPDMLAVVSVLLNNIKVVSETLTYTYLSEAQFDEYQLSRSKLGDATLFISSNIIANVGNAKRGFIVYPYFQEENTYTVRFRSNDNSFPVNVWASQLGGGGHIQSAATRLHANSVEEAISIVLSVATKES